LSEQSFHFSVTVFFSPFAGAVHRSTNWTPYARIRSFSNVIEHQFFFFGDCGFGLPILFSLLLVPAKAFTKPPLYLSSFLEGMDFFERSVVATRLRFSGFFPFFRVEHFSNAFSLF